MNKQSRITIEDVDAGMRANKASHRDARSRKSRSGSNSKTPASSEAPQASATGLDWLDPIPLEGPQAPEFPIESLHPPVSREYVKAVAKSFWDAMRRQTDLTETAR